MFVIIIIVFIEKKKQVLKNDFTIFASFMKNEQNEKNKERNFSF